LGARREEKGSLVPPPGAYTYDLEVYKPKRKGFKISNGSRDLDTTGGRGKDSPPPGSYNLVSKFGNESRNAKISASNIRLPLLTSIE
jgi:hypothetical protein